MVLGSVGPLFRLRAPLVNFLGSSHVFRRMDDGFLQIQDGGGLIEGFGLELIDHGLKDGDLLWF